MEMPSLEITAWDVVGAIRKRWVSRPNTCERFVGILEQITAAHPGTSYRDITASMAHSTSGDFHKMMVHCALVSFDNGEMRITELGRQVIACFRQVRADAENSSALVCGTVSGKTREALHLILEDRTRGATQPVDLDAFTAQDGISERTLGRALSFARKNGLFEQATDRLTPEGDRIRLLLERESSVIKLLLGERGQKGITPAQLMDIAEQCVPYPMRDLLKSMEAVFDIIRAAVASRPRDRAENLCRQVLVGLVDFSSSYLKQRGEFPPVSAFLRSSEWKELRRTFERNGRVDRPAREGKDGVGQLAVEIGKYIPFDAEECRFVAAWAGDREASLFGVFGSVVQAARQSVYNKKKVRSLHDVLIRALMLLPLSRLVEIFVAVRGSQLPSACWDTVLCSVTGMEGTSVAAPSRTSRENIFASVLDGEEDDGKEHSDACAFAEQQAHQSNGNGR